MSDKTILKASNFSRIFYLEAQKLGSEEQVRYHLYGVYEYEGIPDINRLRTALQNTVDSNYNLRSNFRFNGEDFEQIIHDSVVARLKECNVLSEEEYQKKLDEQIKKPFDLENGNLFRFVLFKRNYIGTASLLLNFHHIILDGTQRAKLIKEVEQHYHKPRGTSISDKDEISYLKNYIKWERKQIGKAELNYELKRLNDFPLKADLPYFKRDTAFKIISTGLKSFENKLYAKLKNFSEKTDFSVFNIIKVIWGVLLSKYCNQEKLVISFPVNTRGKQFQDIKGAFVNTLLYPHENKGNILDILQNDRTNFSRKNKYLSVAEVALHYGSENFNINTSIAETELSPVKLNLHGRNSKAIFPTNVGDTEIHLAFEESDDRFFYSIYTQKNLFEETFLSRLNKHFVNLLSLILEHHEADVNGISVLSLSEYKKIIYDWNDTYTIYPRDKTIHQLFEEQAESTPDKAAVVFENEKLTYRELNEKANRLAHTIRREYAEQWSEEVKGDTLIGIYIERSLDMIIGILGILKSGAAYVPFDRSDPEDRLKFKINDCGCRMVLTSSNRINDLLFLVEDDILALCIDGHVEKIEYAPKYNPDINGKPENLAYVIYTSGSTGYPKGVMIEHRNVVNLITDRIRFYEIESMENILLFNSYAFDASVEQIFISILGGATLFIISDRLLNDVHGLETYLLNNNITHLNIPSQFLPVINPDLDFKLKRVVVGGDVCNIDIAAVWNKRVTVINNYGPTESTVSTTSAKYKRGQLKDSLTIGSPISNTHVYLLNPSLQPVPVGVPGELYIGGDGLARGYYSRPEQTAGRFMSNPFVATNKDKKNVCNQRIYKTGDICRYLPDGNIEFMGRRDEQVKIRDFRVELGEIESKLSLHEKVKQSVVLCKERESGDKYLAAYYTVNNSTFNIQHSTLEEELQVYMRDHLPDYMVPSVFVYMDKFPLNISGKVDKKELPEPGFRDDAVNSVPPTTDIERQLCDIWEEILGIDKIGIEDDFFRVGGDSILSIQLVSKMRKIGFKAGIKDIFERRTINKLSELQDRNSKILHSTTEQGVLEGEFDLLPVQKQFFENSFAEPNHWNQSFLIKVPELDFSKLKDIPYILAQRNDILRATFDGHKQKYNKSTYVPEVVILNVNNCSDAELYKKFTDLQSVFNIKTGPMWSIAYLYGFEDRTARIFFAAHHLIIDSVSWRIIKENIKDIYNNTDTGRKTSSYRQWVKAVKSYAESYKNETEFWEKTISGQPVYTKFTLGNNHINRVGLSEEYTYNLLHLSNKAYNTEVNDLLLTAFAYSLKEWSGKSQNYLTLEGHGREEIFDDIDLSQTVGWFTSVFPLKLELQKSLKDSIKNIKETLRSIPNKGIGYGALKYFGNSEKLSKHSLPPISFNYLGQFNTKTEDWQIIPQSAGRNISIKNKNNNIIDVNGFVSNGKLSFEVAVKLPENEAEKLFGSFNKHLEKVIKHCSEKKNTEFTASDFSAADISSELLDKLQNRLEIEDILPANSLQQGFIYYVLANPEDEAYRVQLLFDYNINLNVNLYKKSWEYALKKYPALRLCFNWDENPIQIICKKSELNLKIHDINGNEDIDKKIKEIQVSDRKYPFDLEKPELMRLSLIKQADNHFVLIMNSHHSILDGWSTPFIFNYVHDTYFKLAAGIDIIQERDTAYIQAQKQWINSSDIANEFWKNKIRELDSANDLNNMLSRKTDLNTLKSVKESKDTSVIIEGKDYSKLKTIAVSEGLTLNTFVQFAWHKLIQVYTSDETTAVGTTVSARNIPVEDIEKSAGLFINTLPLIISWEENSTVVELLKKIHSGIYEITNYNSISLAELQSGGKRLFHSLFFFANHPAEENFSDRLSFRFRDAVEKLDYPLGITAYNLQNKLYISLKYAGEYLDESKAEKFILHLQRILTAIPENLNKAHSELSLLSNEEYKKLIYDYNCNEVYFPKEKSVFQLFEEQVEKSPDNIAAIYEDKRLSYKELHRLTVSMSTLIKNTKQTDKNNALIVFYLDRNIYYLSSMLAVWRKGYAFVPLNPLHPKEKNRSILRQFEYDFILAEKKYYNDALELAENSAKIILPEDAQKKYDYSVTGVAEYDPESLAYIIFTSGSTGTPKGAMVRHKGMLNHIFAKINDFRINTSDRVAQTSAQTFDVSVWQFLTALLNGGTTVILSDNNAWDVTNLLLSIKKNKISIFESVPSHMVLILEELEEEGQKADISYLKWFIMNGEGLPFDYCRRWFSLYPEIAMANVYGPTECSDDITHYKFESVPEQYGAYIPIGKPIQNTKHFILDKYLKPVPQGVQGELYVTGDCVGLGYINNQKKTSENFISNPFQTRAEKNGNKNAVLYKTGDSVRMLPDGNIDFLGRNDDQIKLNGQRIELGEIESKLSSHEQIKQSVVLCKEQDGKKYLIAYYNMLGENESSSSEKEEEFIGDWTEMYELAYQEDYTGQVGYDFSVWNSSYTNRAIPLEEMEEWRDTTVERILELRPENIFEIGCGSGLLLYPLRKFCKKYYGIDPSASVIDKLLTDIKNEKIDNVFVGTGKADDIGILNLIPDSESLNTSVINSVIQYFPSLDYLEELILKLIERQGEGTIFIGDIRDYRIINEFFASIELYKAVENNENLSVGKIKYKLNELTERIKELIVSPEFFIQLAQRDSRINYVELLPKRGKSLIEMNIFRYDIIIHIGKENNKSTKTELEWKIYNNSFSVKEVLNSDNDGYIAVKNYPVKRIYDYHKIVESIKEKPEHEDIVKEYFKYKKEKQNFYSIEELFRLAEENGYKLYAGLSLEKRYCCDLVFYKKSFDFSKKSLFIENCKVPVVSDISTDPLKKSEKQKLTSNELSSFLAEKMPDYMIPSIFVLVEEFPLTHSGKVDKKALPAPELKEVSLEYVEPVTDLERKLCKIWQDVLKVEKVGVTDDFFKLGGNSMLVIKLANKISKETEINLNVAEIFKYSTISSIISNSSISTDKIFIPRTDLKKAPLSFAQERLWFLYKYGATKTYKTPIILELGADINLSGFKNAIQKIVKRHEALRTVFIQNEDGLYLQAVQDEVLGIEEYKFNTLEEVKEHVEKSIKYVFNLETEYPLRLIIYKTEVNCYAFFDFHHIAVDGWSIDILFKELETLYTASSEKRKDILPELPIQYKDFAVWQRKFLSGNLYRKQLEYWKDKLKDLKPLNFPTDFNRPEKVDYSGDNCKLEIDSVTSKALVKLAKQKGTTLYNILLTGFYILLYKYTRQNDITVGVVNANRHYPQTEDLIGLFVNTFARRFILEDNLTVNGLIDNVISDSMENLQYSDIPFQKVVETLNLQRKQSEHSLFNICFAAQSFGTELKLFKQLDITQQMHFSIFDLILFINDNPGNSTIKGFFNYSTALYKNKTIKQIISRYKNVLKGLLKDVNRQVEDIDIFSKPEYDKIVYEWNKTETNYPRNVAIHRLFEEQALKYPDNTAVIFEDKKLNYKELNKRSNSIANVIQSKFTGGDADKIPENPLIGIYIERSLEMIAGILGILKSGAAYLPFDDADPADRLKYKLEDSKCKMILTSSKYCENLISVTEPGTQIICIDELEHELNSTPISRLERFNNPRDIAYVIYTSGSTGKPKGVMVEHRSIVNLVRNTNYTEIKPSDTIGCLASISFDAATFEIWAALANGAACAVLTKDTVLNEKKLKEEIKNKQISKVFMTTTLFCQLAKLNSEAIYLPDELFFGGEACDLKLVREVLSKNYNTRIVHVYGPTETTTFATYCDLTLEKTLNCAPIGKPLSGKTVYILDEKLCPVGIGIPGELYIGGDGVASGYLNPHELTSERFIENPFATDNEVRENRNLRIYKTGDICRWLSDGNIEFIGRNDNQVKIRGFRIELGEIENKLLAYDDISQCVVLCKQFNGNKYLAAYYSTGNKSTENETESLEENFVETWSDMYEIEYQKSFSGEADSNFIGWNSSYTGKPIPVNQMKEWQNSTLDRIFSLKPENIFEIGCGTGLLLYPLQKECRQYYGIDFSSSVINLLKSKIQITNIKNINLETAKADEIGQIDGLPELNYFDTVIINSVVQYFPSLNYLKELLLKLTDKIDNGKIYIGDIRDFRLIEEFHVSVEINKLLSDKRITTTGELKKRVEKKIKREKELLISPEFFIDFAKDKPHVNCVELLPKRGKSRHEMNLFRYDIILHVGRSVNTGISSSIKWKQFTEEMKLPEVLNNDREYVAIRNYPNKRIWNYYKLNNAINQDQGNENPVNSYSELQKEGDNLYNLEEIYNLAADKGYKLYTSFSSQHKAGYDLFFYREGFTLKSLKKNLFRENLNSSVDSEFSNTPSENLKKQNISSFELNNYLSGLLPDYMIPSSYVHMDPFPLNTSGKIDKNALPEPRFRDMDSSYTAPETELEKQVCEIWQKVLGIDKIGIKDDFFRIGGNSILAIQLANEINSILNTNIKISEFFNSRNISELVKCIKAENKSGELMLLNNYKEGHENIYFIHSGIGGCEVYKELALCLNSQYNVYGIDNYNLNNDRKIENITELAEYYLNLIHKKHNSSVYKIGGWSLGGQIAMEIASILEQKGTENIKLLLIDSGLPDSEGNNKTENILPQYIEEYLLDAGYENDYIQKNLNNVETTKKLSEQNISRQLNYTEVKLLKATQSDPVLTKLSGVNYTSKYPNNNIDKGCRSFSKIEMDCNHGNILHKSDLLYEHITCFFE